MANNQSNSAAMNGHLTMREHPVKSLPLHRVQLSQRTHAILNTRGIRTARELLVMSELELRETLDMSIEEVRSIVLAVSRKVAPAPETVLQLVERAKSQPQFLQMGDVGIDDMLKGGFNAGGITEIVGMAGMGKTQICLTLAVVATMAESCGGSGGRTLFIDTESRFNTSRLLEIAANKFPDAFTSDNDTQDLAERVLVSRPRTCAELMVTLSNLQNYVIEHSIKCIIVDSIAALPRSEYSNDHIIQRQEMLGRQAIAMKAAAEKFCIPVVVTNQVTTRLSPSETEDGYGSYITAALGTKWAHCVNTRIMLHQPSIDGRRCMEVVKSPCIPSSKVFYTIDATGLQSIQSEAEI